MDGQIIEMMITWTMKIYSLMKCIFPLQTRNLTAYYLQALPMEKEEEALLSVLEGFGTIPFF